MYALKEKINNKSIQKSATEFSLNRAYFYIGEMKIKTKRD